MRTTGTVGMSLLRRLDPNKWVCGIFFGFCRGKDFFFSGLGWLEIFWGGFFGVWPEKCRLREIKS
jgi:hypothetical protein